MTIGQHKNDGNFLLVLRDELSKIYSVPLTELASDSELRCNCAFEIAFGLACKATGRANLFKHFLDEVCVDDEFHDDFVLMVVTMLKKLNLIGDSEACKSTDRLPEEKINNDYYSSVEHIYDKYCDEVLSEDCDKTDYLEIDGRLIL